MSIEENTTSTTKLTAQDERRLARRAAWFWGTLVVTFLGMQVAIGAVAIVLATGDPSVAVVPDYYQKALDWDKSMEAQRVSDLLGWTANIQIGEPLDQTGQRYLSVRVLDSAGNGVDDLQGKMRLFHHARAMDIQEVYLEFLGSGVYRGKCLMERDGYWDAELKFAGKEDAERFLDVQTIELSTSTSTAGAAE